MIWVYDYDVKPGIPVAMFGLVALAVALPLAATAADDADAPHLAVTTVCIIPSDYLGGAVAGLDGMLGIDIGEYVPECEVTAEYVEAADEPTMQESSVTVDMPVGALFPVCAEDDSCFDPHTVTIGAGTEVVWTNSDTVLHTVTDLAGAFNAWLLPGEEFAFTFDTPGTYMYGCTVHPWASGVVAVESDAAPEPEPTVASGLAEAAVEGVLALFETYGVDGALEMVNAMAADPDPVIAVFVIDTEANRIVAHSAIPQYVGLSTVPVLEKAFIPAETMLDIVDTHDGVWLSYPVADPQGNLVSYDRGWFKKYDGYVVAARYNVGPAESVQSVVYEMVRLYDYDPANAFETISGFMSTFTSYPFVLDPETDTVVAHGSNPARVGATSVVLTQADKPKAQILEALAGGAGTWVEYTFNNPSTGMEEAKRSWLVMHDGYIFGSGYYNLEPEKAVAAVTDIIAAYDADGVSAFDAVNAMESEGIYPFAVDAETLAVVAEGAFPRVVGLPATFLDDADRPLEDIMAELEASEGVWAEYVFHNPKTASYEAKTSYLTLHDGYIFGSGYYTSPDAGAVDAVESVLRLYGALGDAAFADIQSVPADAFNAPFVLDAGTLDVVAHADPNVSGGAVRDAIISGQSLEFVYDALDRHGSMWVSYPSTDPAPGSEYTRAYMTLHDGYVFASGYGMDADSRLQSVIDESVRTYEREGDAAFGMITSMDMTRQVVYDLQTYTILALSGSPEFVGLMVPPAAMGLDLSPDELMQLYAQGGAWFDNFEAIADGMDLRESSWSVLQDGRYVFMAQHVYFPEADAMAEVGAAIDVYKTHGKAAFDRITWQATNPVIIYPFVFDAETWRTVAHAAYPDRLGMQPASIMADNDLDEISAALDENGSAWVSYQFYNPITDLVEYKRTYLALYDGYIFAAGYYYGNFDHAVEIIAGAISEYDADGEAAFGAINSEASGSLDFSPIVLDYNTLDVVAHGGHPQLVGQNIADIATNGAVLADVIGEGLMEDGDTVLASSAMLDPQTGQPIAKLVIFQLRDEYVFATAQPMAVYTQ